MMNPLKLCFACRSSGGVYPNIEGFTCTKRPLQKLCDQIDLQHFQNMNHLNGQSIDYHNVLKSQKVIEQNKIEIEKSFKNGKLPLPKDEKGFLYTIKKIHEELFYHSGVSFGGRFREIGETVYIDLNKNQFQGHSPQKIHEGLRNLWHDVLYPKIKIMDERRLLQSELSQLGADFLSYFFRIHPFLDGNGRTGRLFFKLLLLKNNYILALKSDSKTKRRYVKALRYAHRKNNNQGFKYTVMQDRRIMNQYLVSFLSKFILDNELENEFLEEEDPYLE